MFLSSHYQSSFSYIKIVQNNLILVVFFDRFYGSSQTTKGAQKMNGTVGYDETSLVTHVQVILDPECADEEDQVREAYHKQHQEGKCPIPEDCIEIKTASKQAVAQKQNEGR